MLCVYIHMGCMICKSRKFLLTGYIRSEFHLHLYFPCSVKFVHLLKRQGHGVGLRIGSNASGVFIKHIHKDGTADIDGQLEIGELMPQVYPW